MSTASDFLEAVRDGNWQRVASLIDNDAIDNDAHISAKSIPAWLIELNAPAPLVANYLARRGTFASEADKMGLLELCLLHSNTLDNAYKTFCLLLRSGLSPNVIVDGGSTLLQKAIEFNRIAEVEQLLSYGVDPEQSSIFGLESTTNIEEAALWANEAAEIALKKFTEKTVPE